MSKNLDYEINKELGECYLFMGELDKAENYYCKAAESDDSLATPYLALATIALQRADIESALNFYQLALAREENDKTLSGLGLVRMDQGQSAEAFDLFSRALNFNPCNAVALHCLVRVGYATERVADVVPFLENSLAANHDENTHISLAGCLVTLGRAAEARQHLEQILAQNPSSPDAQDLYHHLAA